MSETKSRRDEAAVGEHEGEWDSVVRRIYDRIKKRPGGPPTTQTSLDLAGEIVRLERRAREADAELERRTKEADSTLEREREAFALRVRDMEDKLRRLEPWLRQLRAEYLKTATERDQLKDDLTRAKTETKGPRSEEDQERIGRLEAQLLEAKAAHDAARVARDAASEEVESLPPRGVDEQRASEDESAKRLAAAEIARDDAAREAAELREMLSAARTAEEETARLREQLAAVEAARLQERLGDSGATDEEIAALREQL